MAWVKLGDVSKDVIMETDAYRRTSPQASMEWLTIEERAIMYGEFKGYAEEKGYKPGWAAAKYKDRFGDWPPASVKATPTLECSSQTRMWIDATMRDFWRTKKRK